MSGSQTPETSGGGTALFVRRPILAFVLNALIVIAGIAALFGVEIRELPDVDRPVITVTTEFEGASAETVDQEITSRVEGAVGRVAGVRTISSNSRFGRSRVTLEFNDDVDLDVAATDTRDAVARIGNNLPDDAEQPEIVKADANAQPVVRVAVTSASRSPQELTELVSERVEDRLISINGVADLQIYGDRDPIFRVDIDQMELASRGLTLADLRDALGTIAFDAPAGDLTGDRQSINVRTTASVNTPAAFEALKIKNDVILGDVASVSLGPAPNETILRANGETGLGLGVIRQATSNTLEISAAVQEVVAELSQTLPEDVNIFITSDDAVFINGSIEEVLKTLGMAVAIVVVVIFIFLRSVSATLIPTLTLPVALIGTLAAVYMVGFSINILTLLALVLATGMVVDDAIVVLENIVRAARERHGSARGGGARHAAGFLCRRHHHGDARGRVHPALLPARTGGRAFSRIRLHARDRGHALVGRGADPVPGAGEPPADGGAEEGPARSLRLARQPAGQLLQDHAARRARGALRDRAFRRFVRGDGGLRRQRHPAGTDAARGSRRGSAARDDTAGGVAELHDLEDAGDRNRDPAAGGVWRDQERVLDHRFRCRQSRLHGDEPCHMGRT